MPIRMISTLACALILGAGPALANRIVNPGFEDPITYDGAPFVGFWEGFQGSASGAAATDTEAPRHGVQHLRLTLAQANDFAGAMQDIPGIVPGEVYVLSGWHRAASVALDLGVEIRIEWRDSGSNMEISRTPNISPAPAGTYSEFTLSAVAPAGADTARLVYAVETFSTAPGGVVDVDDMVFIRDGETAAEDASWSRVKTMYR